MTNPNQVHQAPKSGLVHPVCPVEINQAMLRFDSNYLHWPDWRYALVDAVNRAKRAENAVDRVMAMTMRADPVGQSEVWELCHENIQGRRPV